MKTRIDSVSQKPCARTAAGETSERWGNEKFQINVIFTTPRGTLAALNAAALLANGLEARIRLLAPQVVPYAYPLDRPPAAIEFMKKTLSDLVRRSGCIDLVTSVHHYLCRDGIQTILAVLAPNSLIVLGGRKRWWFTEENRLARKLRSKGHQVVVAGRR